MRPSPQALRLASRFRSLFFCLLSVALISLGAAQRAHSAEPTEAPTAQTNTVKLSQYALDKTNTTATIRPYVHLRSGEFDTIWGVQDMWGLGVGADITRHVGVELAFDSYEKDFDPMGTKIGEQSMLSLVPQVRLRWPLANDRVVPYVIAGAGIGWYDFNDPTKNGFGVDVDAQGTKFVVTAGIGIDLLINPQVAFNLEGKYIWMDTLDVSIDGTPATYELSDFVATFGFRAYMDAAPGLALADGMEDPPIRLYFGAAIGFGLITDGNWVPGVQLVQEPAAIGTAGESVELLVGANFGRHISVELPVDYFESVIELDNPGGIPVTGGVGEYSTYAFIPHARFRWPIKSGKIVPYLMAGFGVTYSEVNDRFDNGNDTTVNSKGFAPAFDVGAGVDYFFNRNVAIFGQVKYIYSWNNKIDIGGMGEQKGDLSWLHLQLGFRLNLVDFGGKK